MVVDRFAEIINMRGSRVKPSSKMCNLAEVMGGSGVEVRDFYSGTPMIAANLFESRCF